QFRAIARQRRGDLRLLWRGGSPIRGRFAPGSSRLFRRLFASHIVILLFVHDNIFAGVAFLTPDARPHVPVAIRTLVPAPDPPQNARRPEAPRNDTARR